jgi:hypothetical protein
VHADCLDEGSKHAAAERDMNRVHEHRPTLATPISSVIIASSRKNAAEGGKFTKLCHAIRCLRSAWPTLKL